MTENVLITAFVTVSSGLVLLLVLWPTPERAVKLLARWGVPDPDEAGRAEALRYLKRRRLVYPFVYVASGFALTGIMRSPGWSAILVSLLIGAVVAEVLAQRPRRGSVREAALTSPGVRDLLSPWSTGAWAVLAVAAVGVSGLGWNTGAGAGLFVAGLVGWLASTAPVRPVPATA